MNNGHRNSSVTNSKFWVKRLTSFLLDPQNRSQLIDLIRSAANQHVLDTETLAIVEGAMNVSDMQARDIMIPRSQAVIIYKDAPIEETLQIVSKTAHSRFPVIDSGDNNVIGILLAKDLLSIVVSERQFEFSLRELLRPALFIPESKRLNILLREFRAHRNHMAIVVDEYGSVAGIITIENVLEQIVGEIEDEHDIDDDSPIMRHSDTTFAIKALTPVEDFNQYFKTNWSYEIFDTVGGIVVNQLGYMPKRNEQITIERFRFTVMRADNRRVYLLVMKILPHLNNIKKI